MEIRITSKGAYKILTPDEQAVDNGYRSCPLCHKRFRNPGRIAYREHTKNVHEGITGRRPAPEEDGSWIHGMDTSW